MAADSGSISGTTAAEIADSIRALVASSTLEPGASLPPARALAAELSVNRNTVVAAYRQLAMAGIVLSRGRAGTVVQRRPRVAQEGFAPGSVLRDIGTGNPDPTRIPDIAQVLPRITGRPVLYGEPVIDEDLEHWARAWMQDAVSADRAFDLTVTGGASDAIERLLMQTLSRDDAVALEDPCFLPSVNTVRLNGYRAVPVPVDEQGMTVAGLRAALEAGARAVVCTPRAQNPTGASLTAERASALREVLAAHPYVLVIEDDHFSRLSRLPYHSLVGPDHRRWALVRSVSKFLGPDMCLAVTASDPETAERLALRLSPGTTWVSHLLQRLALALLTDPTAGALVDEAAAHYAARNAAFARAAGAHGIDITVGDGLNVWVPVGADARAVAEQLMRRGWLARTGDDFALHDPAAAEHLRLTIHDLSDDDAERLAVDLAAAIRAARARKWDAP